jgi:hypothetical protein
MNGLVAARCPEWLQSSLTILITLFKWIGLRTNTEKSKVMMCLPGKIRVTQTDAEYASQQIGLGTSTTKRGRIDCNVCGPSLVAESLQSHLETQHNIFWSFVFNRDIILHTHQMSTMLPNCPPPACTFARCQSVAGSQGTGLTYATIFLCNIPRILFAFQLRAPNPYRSARVVDCRCRWPQCRLLPHRAVSAGMGDKTASCGCHAFPGGPQMFVYGVRGRTGKSGGCQVLEVAHCT